MKTITLILTLLIITTVSYADTARDFTLPDIDDNPVSLPDFIGEYILIIDFWASWCGPCMRLMPELEKIHKEYDDIKVIAISVDDPRSLSRAKSLIRSQKYTMTALFDSDQQVMERYQVTGIPHTFIVDYDGDIIYEHTGYTRGDEEEFIEIIEEYKASLEE